MTFLFEENTTFWKNTKPSPVKWSETGIKLLVSHQERTKADARSLRWPKKMQNLWQCNLHDFHREIIPTYIQVKHGETVKCFCFSISLLFHWKRKQPHNDLEASSRHPDQTFPETARFSAASGGDSWPVLGPKWQCLKQCLRQQCLDLLKKPKKQHIP